MTETNELAADDPRTRAAVAVQTARSVADAITIDQLDLPTPCGDYTVRDLLGHLIVAFKRLDMVGQKHEGDWGPLIAEGVADGGHSAALEAAAHGIMATWSDDSLLGEMLVLPFAQLPGTFAVGLYAGEYLNHAWDLAVATSQTVAWPDGVVAPALAGLKFGLPANGREDPEMPFGPVVEVADDAPLIEQLAAWSGRNPADWPSAV